MDPEDADAAEAREIRDRALPLLPAAAQAPVDGIPGDPVSLTAIEDAINSGHFDEIILSTLPKRVSRRLRLDLPSKVGGLGCP